ncbi:hypothetical protein HPB48_015003 [Haemaphysalis longicornis]|uniref:Uncharacterized protein n=1 Tax=Haemaphysalis longicornis TaxID=44386 RepID=A0A9J6FT14_HAELO|nr:hypothetical protein HPB48_015003 [Haemaphysalis longicornis]
MLLLFRKCLDVVDATKQQVIRVNSAQFDWVESLKRKAFEYESRPFGKNIWLLADDVHISGVHRRREYEGKDSGCSLQPQQPVIHGAAEAKTLVMNIYRHGQWRPQDGTQFAFLNQRTHGDLSSLQWYESPLAYNPPSCGAKRSSAQYTTLL